MKKSNKAIIFIFCLVNSLIKSQNTTVLSYNDYLNNILKYHPVSNQANNLVKGANYNYKAQRGSYDPSVSGNYENKFFDKKDYYSNFNAEIKQPIFTSQYIKAGYDYGVGNYVNPEKLTPTDGLPFLGVEASLLQGMLFDKRRAGVLKAKEYINYSESEKNQMLNDLIYEALTEYAELCFNNKQINTYKYFISLARERNNGIKNLADVGEKPSIDTIEASITYQTRVLDIQSLLIQSQKIEAQIKSYNWLETGNTSYDTKFIISDSLETLYTSFKSLLARELNNDTINNPIIAQYKSKQAILEIEKRLKSEMIKPKLDVKYNALAQNQTAFASAFSPNNYKWGASLSFPLFLRTSRNEFKAASINVQNAKLQIDSKTTELNNKIINVKQNIILLSQQLNLALQNAEYSKRLLEAEKLKFDNGESSLFLLNTRESKWLENELKLSAYKLKFIQSTLQLIHLKGNLNYKI